MTIYTQNGEIQKDVNSVIELIAVFDSMTDKPLYLNHIGNNICFWGDDHPEDISNEDFIFEKLAFRLMENHNKEAWGTLFGPMAFIPFADGTSHIDPKFEEITPDAITYWETRAQAVSNPVIKLQYMGLVYSFKEKVTGAVCDQSFLEEYVTTMLQVSKDGWELDFMSTTVHLPLAMEIAKGLPHLLPDVKAEFLRLTTTAKDTHVGVWLAYFDFMLSHITDKKLFDSSEKTTLVSLMETRLTSLMSKAPDAEGEDKLNPFDVKSVAERLAKYYKQINNKAEKERVVRCIDTAFRGVISQGNPMQQMMWLQTMQHCYSTFGMTAESQALYPEIQEKGVEVKNYLQPHSYQITIPTHIIDAFIAEIMVGSVDEIFDHFVDKFTIKKKAASDFVKKQALNPLTGLMGTQILSESGMPLSKIGTPEYDKEGNEYSFGAKLIEHEEFLLRHVIEVLISSGIFSKESIVSHIMQSGLINENRTPIIEKGIDFYLNGEYVTACHLLIPQIEHAICNLALKLGVQALRMQPSGDGYMVQLMDKLFDVQEIHDSLGDDATFYLRTLLTEQRGCNLRNLLCHGLITPLYFDKTKADRIIHALLLVGGLKNESPLAEGEKA